MFNFIKKHKQLVKYSTIGIMSIILISLILMFFLNTALAIKPHHDKNNISVNKSFVIDLGQSLRQVDIDTISIKPAVKGGKWIHQSSGLFGGDKLVFEHDADFEIDTQYTVEFGSISRYLIGDSRIPSISFRTEKAPSLDNDGIVELKDGDTIAADYMFSIKLASPNNNLRSLKLKIEPAINLKIASYDDINYTWRVSDDQLLPQGQMIKVEVYDEKNGESLITKNFKVADEPTVKSMVKADYFGEKDVATLEFDQPIANSDDSNIIFDLDGSGSWVSDTKYVFTPSKVEAGKTYSYHIKSGLKSVSGGILTNDIDGTFKTVGPVSVSGSSPTGKELTQSQQKIKFTFDQPVDKNSAESRFSISNGTITGFSWSNNSMIVTVKDLGFQNTVTAKVNPGVVNAGFGLPSDRSFSVTFSTEIRSKKLGVPMIRQEHAATCGLASLRMGLAYYGINTDEMTILGRMSYNPREMDRENNTWDDPREMFVGYIDGTSIYTSSGVETPLIARTARSFGRNTTERIGDSVHVGWIAEEIYNGHPVVISGTGTNKKPYYYSWTAPNGRTVTSASNGHARIVTGVKGEPGKPIGFWINDPLAGSLYWTADKLQANLRTNPYGGMAVSIY